MLAFFIAASESGLYQALRIPEKALYFLLTFSSTLSPKLYSLFLHLDKVE
jgi:hypothetical protein